VTPSFAPTVIIPAYGRIESTRRCLESLRVAGARRLILIDDCGTAGGDVLAREYGDLDVVTTAAPVWWTGAIVLGLARAMERGDRSFLLFNQDVTAAPDYLEKLEQTERRYPGAMIGSTVLYATEPGRVWSAGGTVEWLGRGIRICHHGADVDALPGEPYPVDWLPGMGTLVSAEAIHRIGTLDAERFPMAWADADFTLRARRQGIPIIVDPRARLRHDVGSYDARVAGPPSLRTYVGWLRDERHNLSLPAQTEIWRRHGPRGLWPLSLGLRALVLLANYPRIRWLHPAPGARGGS
jgi:GT2 family glycosyltransferase